MYHSQSVPEPPSNSFLPLNVPLSNEERLAQRHSIDVGRSQYTLYCSYQKPLFQFPPSSFSIPQPRIKYAQLLLKHTSLKQDFDALKFEHAALLRAQSAR